jgi:hypothetical protein
MLVCSKIRIVLCRVGYLRSCFLQYFFLWIITIRIWIYLPFWPDKVMRNLHCWEWQQSSISAFFFFSSVTHGHKTCYLTLRFASECLLSIPRAQHLNGLLTMLK